MMLGLPKLRLEHRLLVNYRAPVDALADMVPAPLRVREIKGFGLAGVCLRRHALPVPGGMGRWLSTSTEVAAHRIAVEWEEKGETKVGLLVLRSDASSYAGVLVGARVFPGPLCRTKFTSVVSEGEVQTEIAPSPAGVGFLLRGTSTPGVQRGSVFVTPQEACGFFRREERAFFARGATGLFFQRGVRQGEYVFEPLQVHEARCGLLEAWAAQQGVSLELDSAFLARKLVHAWHRQEARAGYRMPAAANFYRGGV